VKLFHINLSGLGFLRHTVEEILDPSGSRMLPPWGL